MGTWFACIAQITGGELFNGRVLADDLDEAERKYLALCPTADMTRVRFVPDPAWKIDQDSIPPAAIEPRWPEVPFANERTPEQQRAFDAMTAAQIEHQWTDYDDPFGYNRRR